MMNAEREKQLIAEIDALRQKLQKNENRIQALRNAIDYAMKFHAFHEWKWWMRRSLDQGTTSIAPPHKTSHAPLARI